ncbi:MAG: hypothetical protein ACFHVJ_00330 [Aestuariibacter sp.]
MSIAVFDLKEVNKLMSELQGDVVLVPTQEQQYNPDLYVDGVLKDIDGRTRQQVEGEGRRFWPDISRIIPGKIPRVLVLKANEKGLYLTTNLKSKLTPFQRGAVVFALGCNPVKDDDWEKAVKQMTPEHLDLTVPISWVVSAIRAKADALRIEISSDGIAQVAA